MRSLSVLFIVLFAQLIDQSSCFWFADSSLFQPPEITPPPPTTTLPQAIPSSSQQANDNQQQKQECQCNLDFIQNQTQWALSRWLNTAQAKQQQQQLLQMVSNSTGAPHIVSRSAAGQLRYWTQPDISNSSTLHQSNQTAQRHTKASNGWPRPASVRHSRHGQQQQQQQQPVVKLVQGERGPPGPKGDTGASGEKGEPGRSGLIVIKDRRELFERSQQNQQPAAGEMLAFLEADQMLVVRTSSGWRPVQLLKPLQDPKNKAAVPIRPPEVYEEDEEDQFSIIGDASIGDGTNDRDEEDEDSDEDDDDDLNDWDEDDEDEDDDEQDDAIIGDERKPTRQQRKNQHSKNELVPFLQRSQAAGRPPIDLSTPAPAPTTTGHTVKVAGRSAVAMTPPLEMRASESSINHQPSSKQLKLRLAALNEPFSGNIHGLRGADFECKRHAAKAQLRGSFRALLATSFQNLNELVRLNTHKYPIVNLRGETLASSWNDLFKQAASANPLSRIYSFDGRHVATDSQWPNKLVWHGAGNRNGFRDLVNNCDGWHSDSLNKFGTATPLHNPRNQLSLAASAAAATAAQSKRRHKKSAANQSEAKRNSSFFETIEKYPCRMPLVVLCIETVGQPMSLQDAGKRFGSENGWDSELSNAL